SSVPTKPRGSFAWPAGAWTSCSGSAKRNSPITRAPKCFDVVCSRRYCLTTRSSSSGGVAIRAGKRSCWRRAGAWKKSSPTWPSCGRRGQLNLLSQSAVLDDLRLDKGQRTNVGELSARVAQQWKSSFRDFGRVSAAERERRSLEQARANEADLRAMLNPEQL